MSRRGLPVALAFVLLGLALGWLLRGLRPGSPASGAEAEGEAEVAPEAMAVEVTTALAVRGDLPIGRSTSGTVIAPPDAIATVSSRAGGRVADVLAVVGQAVHRGDLLLRFERAPLEVDVAKAKGELAKASSELVEYERAGRDQTAAQLESSVHRARAEHALAQAQRERLEALRTEKLVAEKAVAEARLAAEQSGLEVELAERALAIFTGTGAELRRGALQAAEDAARAAVADAEALLAGADVTAAADGVLARVAAQRGDRFDPGAPLATLITGPTRLLACACTLREAARIAPGARATWRDALGAEHLGTVARTVPAASAAGFIDVIVAPSEPAPALPPGALVAVELVEAELKDAVLVPEQALVRAQDQLVVVLVDAEQRAKVTPVEIRGRHGGLVAVAGAVSAGDRVIIAGGYNLPDGAHVVLPEAAATKGAGTGKDGASEHGSDRAEDGR